MLHSSLATNPYALTAVVCAATFVVAPITLTVYRYAAFLTLITFHSLILCQYKCAPFSSALLLLPCSFCCQACGHYAFCKRRLASVVTQRWRHLSAE